jgi:hypothetical protein
MTRNTAFNEVSGIRELYATFAVWFDLAVTLHSG